MKIHDFGLWFKLKNSDDSFGWSTTIPPEGFISIWYDGDIMGQQNLHNFDLSITTWYAYKMRLRDIFSKDYKGHYQIGRRLTLEDFEIVENTNYKGLL
jgi:hypothetical protein